MHEGRERVVEHAGEPSLAQLDAGRRRDSAWKPSRNSAISAWVFAQSARSWQRPRCSRGRSRSSVDKAQHRVDRRRFELVADRAVDRMPCRGSDRSTSSAARLASLRLRLDRTVAAAQHHRMQEGARCRAGACAGRARLAAQQAAPATRWHQHGSDHVAVPALRLLGGARCRRAVELRRPRSAAQTPLDLAVADLQPAHACVSHEQAWRRGRARPGIVVTSIDCLALVGQPSPHEPRFQQPLTLRWIAAAAMPSCSAPCAAARCSGSARPARG